MLHHLQLSNTGPAPALQLELAPRLNLITGDNSLGKNFLLDVAWYCLTRRWPQELNPGLNGGAMAQPTQHTAIQLLLVTHSPLVMASVEPLFDPERDRWWDLDWSEANQQVELTVRPFNRYGDANN